MGAELRWGVGIIPTEFPTIPGAGGGSRANPDSRGLEEKPFSFHAWDIPAPVPSPETSLFLFLLPWTSLLLLLLPPNPPSEGQGPPGQAGVCTGLQGGL